MFFFLSIFIQCFSQQQQRIHPLGFVHCTSTIELRLYTHQLSSIVVRQFLAAEVECLEISVIPCVFFLVPSKVVTWSMTSRWQVKSKRPFTVSEKNSFYCDFCDCAEKKVKYTVFDFSNYIPIKGKIQKKTVFIENSQQKITWVLIRTDNKSNKILNLRIYIFPSIAQLIIFVHKIRLVYLLQYWIRQHLLSELNYVWKTTKNQKSIDFTVDLPHKLSTIIVKSKAMCFVKNNGTWWWWW